MEGILVVGKSCWVLDVELEQGFRGYVQVLVTIRLYSVLSMQQYDFYYMHR